MVAVTVIKAGSERCGLYQIMGQGNSLMKSSFWCQ